MIVLPDAATTQETVETLANTPMYQSPEDVRTRVAIGTPDEVYARLALITSWGVDHLICSIGAAPFMRWSDAALDLFVSDVLPRLRRERLPLARPCAKRGGWERATDRRTDS